MRRQIGASARPRQFTGAPPFDNAPHETKKVVMDALVSTEWLAAQSGAPDLRIADCSWFLPTEHRDAAAEFRAAHATAEFRGLVGQEAWRAFPSRPALYELVVSAG